MTGWDGNRNSASFHQADVDEAGERVAVVLREEQADVFTIYDWHGTYGHPDHVKVQPGRPTCGGAGRSSDADPRGDRQPRRDGRDDQRSEGVRHGDGLARCDADDEFDPAGPADDGNPFGEPESVLTLRVDVTERIEEKRASMRCHRSQISDSSFFLEMADEVFAMAFGVEWFIEHDRQPPHRDGWIFDVAARPLTWRPDGILDPVKIAVTSGGCPRLDESFRAR